jgi:hypothetical protein
MLMDILTKESQLFDWLKANRIPDLIKQDNEFSSYDCYSIKNKAIIELKCRGKHYPTLLLEKKKWIALMMYNCNVRYICSTPEGIYSFDLNALVDIEWVEQKHNKTTQFHNNNKVPKLIFNIPIEMGIKLF